ncbi:MAG: hypothetical protein ACRCZS_23810 [Chroococcidiopsis sp.]
MNNFYPLTHAMGKKLRSSELTAAEWRLWSYLVELDPWGDRYLELPDLITIMKEAGIKKTTFYEAIAKLQEKELFDFQSRGFDFRNLDGASSFVRPSKRRKIFRKSGNSVRESGTNSVETENRPPEHAPRANPSSSQTLSDLTDYSYSPLPPFNGGEEGEGASPPPLEPHPQKNNDGTRKSGTNPLWMGTNPRAVGTNPVAMETNPRDGAFKMAREPRHTAPPDEKRINEVIEQSEEINSVVIESEVIPPNENPPACNTIATRRATDGIFGRKKPSRQEMTNPYPDGEWMRNGNLDLDFVTWLATAWLISDREKYRDIHNARKCVRLHFVKNPPALPIQWQHYHEETKYRYENAQTRIQHGIDVKEDEQQMLMSRARAVVTPIEELQPQSVSHQSSVISHQLPVNDDAELPSDNDSSALHMTENSNAYKPWQPATTEDPATDKDWEQMRSRMSGIFNPMPSREQTPATTIEQLQADLADSVSRQDFDVQAKCRKFLEANSRYEAECDRNGLICAIELEF